MYNEILFTHDDMDGAGCRIVYQLHKLNDDANSYKIFNCANNNIDAIVENSLSNGDISKDTLVSLGDICASREVLEKLVNASKQVRIWDHHRTNFYATWVVPEAVIVPENELGVMQSGTSLMYQGLSSDPDSGYSKNNYNQELLSKLVDTIRSYDTYEWKESNNQDARKLQILFNLLGMERFCNRYIERIKSDKNNELLLSTDLEFIDYKLEFEQRVISQLSEDDFIPLTVNGYRCAFTYSTMGVNVSEYGNQMLEKFKNFDVFIHFSMASGTFSFRAIRDDIDLGSEIARPIGGGGHPKAAGASLDSSLKEIITKMIEFYLNKR